MSMKYILLICIILVTSISHTYASSGTTTVTLRPSLTVQMERQTKIDKRNRALTRVQEARIQKVTPPSKSQVPPSQNTTKKSLTPTLTIPPVPPTATISQTSQPSYTPPLQQSIPWVDIARVRSTWISWYNDGRIARWLGTYIYDSRLDSTAHDWNIVFAGSRGTNFHERSPGDGYYNYPVINKWFQDRGINPPVVAWVNHSENVSYGYYACAKADCTDDLINAIRSSYIFFINSAVHSKSVYQPNFTKIGLDIIVVPSENRYYVTVHYMTK